MVPRVAEAIARAAAVVASFDSLVDLFCGGGGFSLGATDAFSGLKRVDGIDNDRIVVRNYQHNLALRVPGATVRCHEKLVPNTFDELCELLGRQLMRGTHLHLSPPCQSFVHRTEHNSNPHNGREPIDLQPYLELMRGAYKSGCTASLEENEQAVELVLRWLNELPAEDARPFYVYRVDARDYGVPCNRVRCIVTTFALEGEANLAARAES